MRLRVHALYFPAEYLDRLDRYGTNKATLHIRKTNNASSDVRDLEVRFRNMDLAKVDMQVLSLKPAPLFRK